MMFAHLKSIESMKRDGARLRQLGRERKKAARKSKFKGMKGRLNDR